MKIVVLDRSSVGEDVSVAPFEKYGEVVLYSNTVAAEAPERVKDADVIVVNKTPMNESTLSGAQNVRLICEFATGFDNIDLDYCRSRGITVVNVRNYSTAVVAQHTFAMALYLLEKLRYYDDYVKNGVYASQSSFSFFQQLFPFRKDLSGAGREDLGHRGHGKHRTKGGLHRAGLRLPRDLLFRFRQKLLHGV